MRTFVLTFLVALSLLVIGCQQQATEPAVDTAMDVGQPAVTDTAAARADIEQVREQWIAAAERDDAAAVAAFYTEDAVVTSPDNAAASEGHQAIQELFARQFPTATGLQVRSTETEISGDLAYDYGEFSQRVTPAKGKAVDVQGRYLVVLKRQGDGSWKIDKHVSFPLPAATQKR